MTRPQATRDWLGDLLAARTPGRGTGLPCLLWLIAFLPWLEPVDGEAPGAPPARGAAPPARQEPPEVAPTMPAPPAGAPKSEPDQEAPRPPAAPTIALPPPGVYPASTLFGLVERLTGVRVAPITADLGRRPVSLAPELLGRRVTLEELKILLAAHHMSLEHHEIPGERAVWVVRRGGAGPLPETPVFLRVFEVPAPAFNRCVEELDRYLQTSPSVRNPGLPAPVVIPYRRNGQIIVQSASRRTIDIIAEILRGVTEGTTERRANRPRLYAYTPRFRAAPRIGRELEDYLDEAERRRLRVVIPAAGNALWIRTTPDLWEKVEKVLRVIDGEGDGEPGRPTGFPPGVSE